MNAFRLSIPVFASQGLLVATLLFTLTACQTLPKAPEHFVVGDYDSVISYLSERIPVEMKRNSVKGLSIALVDGQEVIWSTGFGMADVNQQIKAGPETLYRIGSVTKPLTALVIMRLHERGLVDIDRPVQDYLPGFSIHSRFGAEQAITLRALLAHHSGLPTDRLAGMWVENPVSLAELVEALRDQSLASQPETQYRYSNTGYSLLGRVIEVVTKKPYAQAMRDELFEPLGMPATKVSVGRDGVPGLAAGYRMGKSYPVLSLRDTPAGGVSSTVTDMAKLLGMLFVNDGSYVKKETLTEIFQAQYPGLAADFGHQAGLGWIQSGLDLPDGEHVVWHNGGAFPHQAHISQLPGHKLGVVILSNSMEGQKFITELGRETLLLMLAAKHGGTPAREPDIEPGKSVQLSVSQLESYTGNYTAFGQLIDIRRKGQKLETSLSGHKFQLVPTAESTFLVRASALGIFSIPLTKLRLRFIHVDNQAVAVLEGFPAPVVLTRIPERAVPKAWQQRLGRYTLNTQGEAFEIRDLELKIENGVLVFLASLRERFTDNQDTQLRIPLMPASDTEAVIWGLGNGEGGTVHALESGALSYSGFILVRDR